MNEDLTPTAINTHSDAARIVAEYRGGYLDLSGCDLTGITLPTSIDGYLDLSGCDLTGVTLPTSIGGYLDLSGCDITGVTLPTSIGGYLDLRGCDITGVTLPTSIGGSLALSGCKNVPNGVYACGDKRRTIACYNHITKGRVVSLGCFVGTEKECVAAIEKHYGDTEGGRDYVAKVRLAFALAAQAGENND